MTYSGEVLTDTPLAYWKLDEASGTTAADSSGNARDATYTGVTLGVSGAIPSAPSTTAAQFAGTTGSHVAQTTFNAWMATTSALSGLMIDHSIEFWVKRSGNPGTAEFLVGRDLSSNCPWLVFLNTDGTIAYWTRRTVGFAGVNSVATVTDGNWHHVVCTFTTSDSRRRIYIDGALDTAQAAVGGSPSDGGSGGVKLAGRTVTGVAGAPGACDLDEVAFYGTALDLTRVAAHYDAAASSPDPTAQLAADTQRTTGSFTVGFDNAPVTLTADTQRTTGAFTVFVARTMQLSASTQRTTADIDVTAVPISLVQLSAQTQRVVADISLNPQPFTDQLGGAGRERDGIGVAIWEPPVDEPASITVGYDRITAHAYTGHTRGNGTRPLGLTLDNLQTVDRARKRLRIVVGGKDVSFFRGAPTPEPTYSLISPLLYGPGSMQFPQVYAAVEHVGTGALDWLHPGATVKVQRVSSTGATTTDWRGFLLDYTIDGGVLTFGLMGEATGRAALRYRPPRIFRHREDLGYWWKALIEELNLDAGSEQDTGIVVQNMGGMDNMTYANELSARGVTRGGAQWTCMPGSDHVYRTKRKDLTTITGTVYFDDAHTVPSLRRDPAEEPARIFATGTSPTGRRIRFAVYPALQQSEAVPYPGPLTQGSTGDGVLALTTRLWMTGYLDLTDRASAYDATVTRAVRDLQQDADLPETGNVNSATWDALFDFGITGHSISGAKIRPAAQQSKVRRYNTTPSGAIIGRNPDFDPHALVPDRAIDVGPGFTQEQVREFARSELADGATANWVGTIVFNTGALISGTHVPGAIITGANLMDAHALKPGDNLWAPLFFGGTLLHVSGVDVNGRTATAQVDTRARDTAEVWEIIARNVESRRNPGRTWLNEHRSSGMDNDAISEWDNVGGQIPDTVLQGRAWNVIPVVAGQEGTIASIRLRVSDEECEFVCAVFGRKIAPRRLLRRVGDPLTAAGTKRWTDETVLADLDANHVLLYVAGSADAPCGYFPDSKVTTTHTINNPAYSETGYDPEADENTTGVDDEPPHLEVEVTPAPNGRWEDDASFGYHAFDDASLWLAVFPAKDCTLAGGRVMRNQMESGT